MKTLLQFTIVLILLVLTSCENEPIGKANREMVIAVNSELYNLIGKAASEDFETEITCINFNYPFNLAVFDENLNVLYYQPILDDATFIQVLGTLEVGLSIAISYPITSELNDGSIYNINSNEELLEAIKQCISQDEVQQCNAILLQHDCVWHINHISGPNSQYTGSYFEVTKLGNAGFFYDTDSYAGSWITYSIENEPHLNINLGDDGNVGEDWNYDWKIIDFSPESMTITNRTDTYLMNRQCEPACNKYIFEACETEAGSGIAVFDLPEYIDCFLPFTTIENPESVIISFYKTDEDLTNNENEITEPFTTTTNPQLIYIQIDDIDTGEPKTSLSILLFAIPCEG